MRKFHLKCLTRKTNHINILFISFETRFCYVAQAVLEPAILTQSPKCWDYRCAPSHLAFLNKKNTFKSVNLGLNCSPRLLVLTSTFIELGICHSHSYKRKKYHELKNKCIFLNPSKMRCQGKAKLQEIGEMCLLGGEASVAIDDQSLSGYFDEFLGTEYGSMRNHLGPTFFRGIL
jgi:hypothetical protein